VLLLPFLLLVIAFIALGAGMLISSLTVKYRDLNFVITFGISLFMYITPIVYPTSLVLEKIDPKYHQLIYLNPLTGLFDFFKFAFLGSDCFDFGAILYSVIFSIVIFFLGLLVFTRTEKSFIDVI
jgi:lipopolysaccharide transport system permease protein